MTAEPDFEPPFFDRERARAVAVWSSQRPRPTIDLVPAGARKARWKVYAPYVGALALALLAGAGAATFATAPSMTDGIDELAGLSAVSARDMGLALTIDPTGQQSRQAAVSRDVGALKSEIARLRKALDQSKANQAALSKAAAGQAAAGQDDVKALKEEVAGLQKTLDATRESSAAKIDALTAKLDQPKEDAARLAELQARIDRLEKTSSTRTAAEPETTGSVGGQPSPDAGAQVVRNWVVRDVYDGVALIEGRNGLVEVMRGAKVPALGRIQKIERRDRQWVVITDRGLILQRP